MPENEWTFLAEADVDYLPCFLNSLGGKVHFLIGGIVDFKQYCVVLQISSGKEFQRQGATVKKALPCVQANVHSNEGREACRTSLNSDRTPSS